MEKVPEADERSLNTRWIRETRTYHCGEKEAQFSWERKPAGPQDRVAADMGHGCWQSRTKPSGGVKVKLFLGSARVSRKPRGLFQAAADKTSSSGFSGIQTKVPNRRPQLVFSSATFFKGFSRLRNVWFWVSVS